jgi:uncharacterized protein (TIGR02444 family)
MQGDNEFWRFSLRVYAAPGVADECLALQERYAIDVNVLLFCAWLAAERRIALTVDDIETCKRCVSEWHARAVKPLRAARQTMKGLTGAESVRADVKALELATERIEQDMLFALAGERWPQHGDAQPGEALRGNLDRFLQNHGAVGSQAVPHLLSAALDRA